MFMVILGDLVVLEEEKESIDKMSERRRRKLIW